MCSLQTHSGGTKQGKSKFNVNSDTDTPSDNLFYVITIYSNNVDHFATVWEFSNINVECCHKQT